MKKTVALFAMLLMMNQGFSQEVKEVTQAEKDAVAQDLEREAESGKHDKKTKALLKKVAKSIKESSQKMVIGVKALDDCSGNCENKTKAGIVVRNVGRGLGKASAWVTTTTSKPFLNAAGFLTGLFEKKDNQDIVALYQFFINHSKEMDQIYLEAQTPQDMIELMLAKMEEIVEAKSHLILKDFLVSLGIKREIPADLTEFELTDAEIACIDMDKVNPDFINSHPEYQELKLIIGQVTQEELEDIIMSGYFDKSIGFDNYKAALPKIHEGAAAVVGQIFGPKIVLGVLSSSLASLYATPVVIADIGTGISTAICLQKTTQEKFEIDEDLGAFCSYVVNRSAYQLMKSRAKGYVAGKKARANILEKRQARKEKRAARRAAREAIRLLAH
jgi:uncharacterized ferredoxin-like protein